MSTFKIKHDRNKNRVHIQTLDETHKKIMGEFEKKRSLLPTKKKKLESLQLSLKNLDDLNPKGYSIDDIKRKAELKEEISNLEEQINDIENDVSEIDYYSKTENIIMDYYEILEMNDHELYQQYPELGEEKKIVKDTNEMGQLDKLSMLNQQKQKRKKVAKKRKRGIQPVSNCSIVDFMSVSQNKDLELNSEVNSELDSEVNSEVNSDKKITVESEKNSEDVSKAKLMDQYMMLVDNDYLTTKKMVNQIKKCLNCNIEKTLIHADGIYVCQTCGEAEPVIVDSEKPNYKEAVPDNKPPSSYKKGNHLNEWLNQILGHKSTYLKVCASYIQRVIKMIIFV